MSPPRTAGGMTNRLLLALPQPAFIRIYAAAETIDLERGRVIAHAGRPIDHLYFVTRGLVSVVKTMRDGRTVEIGAIGTEGVTGLNALFGIDSGILDLVVQVPGTALRVRSDILREIVLPDPVALTMMRHYARFSLLQLTQAAACNRLHTLEERCCRWLLIAHDNALSDTFPLTHEFLAMMLGVQRAGVSLAANLLRRSGWIRYTRGLVTITDRAGLERSACECRRTMAAELEALFPSAAVLPRFGALNWRRAW